MTDIKSTPDKSNVFNYLDLPSLIIFWLLFGIVALQFITRYLFNDSFGWTEEIARYFLMILGFVGGINCVRKNKHIFLEFFYRYISKQTFKPIVIIVETIVAIFFTYLGYLSIELATRSAQNMASIHLPKSIIYYIIMVACFLMALFAFINIRRYLSMDIDALYDEKLNSSAV